MIFMAHMSIFQRTKSRTIGEAVQCTSTYIIIASYWNVFESVGIGSGLHESTIDRPKLIEFVADKPKP